MLHFLTLGTVLGLSAGFAPGPLLTLVVSETLKHGIRAGVKVALAPIVTDLPIIILTMLVLSRLSSFHHILGVITLVGAVVVLLMGLDSVKTKGFEIDATESKQNSLMKGALTNILSPHPYLFWFSVGAPTMTKAMDQSTAAAAGFVVCFYLFLVGSKIVLAFITGKSRSFFKGNIYLYTMRFLGLLLCVLALVLFRDGLGLLGVI